MFLVSLAVLEHSVCHLLPSHPSQGTTWAPFPGKALPGERCRTSPAWSLRFSEVQLHTSLTGKMMRWHMNDHPPSSRILARNIHPTPGPLAFHPPTNKRCVDSPSWAARRIEAKPNKLYQLLGHSMLPPRSCGRGQQATKPPSWPQPHPREHQGWFSTVGLMRSDMLCTHSHPGWEFSNSARWDDK